MNKLNLKEILIKSNIKSNLFNMYIGGELKEDELVKQFEMLSESNVVIYFLLEVIKDLYNKVDAQTNNGVVQTISKTEEVKKPQLTIEQIRKLNEKQLVEYAISLDIPVTTKDRKSDTLAKILLNLNKS
jgi:chemotaxis methyl-accepting protein methylase